MLIDDDEFEAIPDDPGLAFVQLVEIARQRTEDKINEERKLFNGNFDGYARWNEFASCIDGLVDALDLKYSLDTDIPRDEDLFAIWLQKLLGELNRISTSIRLKAARSKISDSDPSLRFGAVDLDNYKEEIRKLTEKIRKIINQVRIPEDLREALFSRLNAFEKDLNRNRTRWESWLALFRLTTKNAGEGAAELEPAIRLLERVSGLMDKAAEDQNSIGYQKRKLLKAPEAIEDDIPF